MCVRLITVPVLVYSISKELLKSLDSLIEDTNRPITKTLPDLAFAVRNIGKKVYYQPASVVTHFEGISSGTRFNSGVKSIKLSIRKNSKQNGQINSHCKKSGSDIELCRIHGQTKKEFNFLMLAPTPIRFVLFTDDESDYYSKRIGYHVIFMPENLSHNDRYTEELQQLGVEAFTPHISLTCWTI